MTKAIAIKVATALILLQSASVEGYRKKRQNTKLAENQMGEQQVQATSFHVALDTDLNGEVDARECEQHASCSIIDGACVCEPGALKNFYKDDKSELSAAKGALLQRHSTEACNEKECCDNMKCEFIAATGDEGNVCACSQRPTNADDVTPTSPPPGALLQRQTTEPCDEKECCDEMKCDFTAASGEEGNVCACSQRPHNADDVTPTTSEGE